MVYSATSTLNNTKTSKAAGLDNLPGIFLKDGAEIISAPVTQLCNLSISHSSFPNECKTAKLIPLYKKGSKLCPKNYRPISLLPLLSKIIEKVIHDQTQKFLNENDILYRFQSGFRKNYSTDLCLSFLNDKIIKGFDKGLLTGMILIDLQKAFDTINHTIFFDKMKALGFSEQVINWFQSYLSNRTFQVAINNQFSSCGNLTCGVPQGSILGPLIFLLYVNDMNQAVDCDLFLYADDSCLVFQHKNVKDIEIQLNKNFSNLCDWFVDNKLSIHFGEDKTKSILFTPRSKINKVDKLNIAYKHINIKQYSKVTYLGCILDESLSGESMAIYVMDKINKKIKFLYRKSQFLTSPLRRLLCNALIQPHFDYACLAWFPNLNKGLKKKIQITQNKCMRFCLQLGSKSHMGYLEFEKINWLPIEDRFDQCVSTHVYKFFHKRCPSYIAEVFNPSEGNCITTRSSYLKLIQPFRRTNLGQRSLSYQGPSIWNKIPDNVKQSCSVNSFKHNLKRYYFDNLKNREIVSLY